VEDGPYSWNIDEDSVAEFERADLDGNDHIDYPEFKSKDYELLGRNYRDDKAKLAAYKLIDIDRDGKISEDDFKMFARRFIGPN